MNSLLVSKNELKERLRRFLEIHNRTRILSLENGTLKMHILQAKAKNKLVKDKLISYKLLRVSERLLTKSDDFFDRDSVVCEFLIDELEKYVADIISKKDSLISN